MSAHTSQQVPPDAAVTPETARRVTLGDFTVARLKANAQAEELARWSEQLTAEVRRYRRRALRARVWRLARFALIALFVYGFFSHRVSGWMWLLFFVGGGGSAAAETRGAKKRQEAATELEKLKDVRAISVLARASRSADSGTRKIATRALEGVLPMLRASDAQYVTDDGMRALLEYLTWRTGALEMRRKVLFALRQVGDARAIPAVRRLSEPPAVVRGVVGLIDRKFHANVSPLIAAQCAEAAETLVYLEQRQEQDRLRATLLRPASAPDDPAALLLRPAAPSVSEVPDEQLVRPVG